MPKAKRSAAWRPRRCKHCKLMYVPGDTNPANAERSKFCNRKCKDSYHRNGGINLPRLLEVVARKVKAALVKDDAFLESLRAKLQTIQEVPTIKDLERAVRIKERLTGTGPIGREAAQALLDSFSPALLLPDWIVSAVGFSAVAPDQQRPKTITAAPVSDLPVR